MRWILGVLLAKSIGWYSVPEHNGQTIKAMCGPYELHYGRRCDAEKTVIDLRCISKGHKYEDYKIENCSAKPDGTAVIWAAIYCDEPDPKAKLPECGGGQPVKSPPP